MIIREDPDIVAEVCGLVNNVYDVASLKYEPKSIVKGVVFVTSAGVNMDCFVVGIGGLSEMTTVSGDTDVPLALVPEMVSEYVVLRYAPVTVNVDPEMDAEVLGFVRSVNEDA